jgi:hypothetical protein
MATVIMLLVIIAQTVIWTLKKAYDSRAGVEREMRTRYSPRQQTLTVNGKKIKQNPDESRSQYWARIKELEHPSLLKETKGEKE